MHDSFVFVRLEHITRPESVTNLNLITHLHQGRFLVNQILVYWTSGSGRSLLGFLCAEGCPNTPRKRARGRLRSAVDEIGSDCSLEITVQSLMLVHGYAFVFSGWEVSGVCSVCSLSVFARVALGKNK
jgi:hypothetical protein